MLTISVAFSMVLKMPEKALSLRSFGTSIAWIVTGLHGKTQSKQTLSVLEQMTVIIPRSVAVAQKVLFGLLIMLPRLVAMPLK